MKLLYVDESGDPGLEGHASPHYILSGLIVSEEDWGKTLNKLKTLRKSLKETYGLNQRTEVHASELIRINKLKEYRNITKSNRINILKDYCSQIPIIFDRSHIINVCLSKKEYKSDRPINEFAWGRLIQRFDTYLKKKGNENGLIISDETSSPVVTALIRKMRIYNPVPSYYGPFRNVPIENIIEDLFERDSRNSYFIQTVDVITYLLYRKEYPKGSLKKYGIEHQFSKLESILLKEASKNDEYGIVRK